MLNKITRAVGIGFAVFWMIFIFLEYWQYHEEARRSLPFFQYTELMLVLLPIGGLLVFVYHRFREEDWLQKFSNGLTLSGISLLLALICINGFFFENLGSFLSLQENLTFLGTILGVAGSVFFIMTVAFGLGRLVYQVIAKEGKAGNSPLVFLAIGILCLVALLFLLGIFNALHTFILWPLLLMLLFISWRSAWKFLQISLLNPIKELKQLNVLGLSVLYLLILLLTINFVQVARPFPTGFDAMTHYVNISSLIRDYHGLVQGHGAYNWSLFMSLGLLLFNKISVTLALSFAGAMLCVFALYRLSRHWLNADLSILVLLLFFSLPMISWLTYRDMKVDMPLLFYSLLIVITLVDFLRMPAIKKTNGPRKKEKMKISPELARLRDWAQRLLPAVFWQYPHLTLIGILAGFSFGIKFSALILLLALIPAIAYAKGGRLAFAAATAFVLAFILFARLDATAGLRSLHLWVVPIQWTLLLVGTGLSVYLFRKEKEKFLRVFRMSLICIVLSGLFLSPWILKNLIETRSLSVTSLTNGENAGPRPGIEQIKQIYQNQQNGN